MNDELRLLRERLESSVLMGAEKPNSDGDEPKVMDVKMLLHILACQ